MKAELITDFQTDGSTKLWAASPPLAQAAACLCTVPSPQGRFGSAGHSRTHSCRVRVSEPPVWIAEQRPQDAAQCCAAVFAQRGHKEKPISITWGAVVNKEQ